MGLGQQRIRGLHVRKPLSPSPPLSFASALSFAPSISAIAISVSAFQRGDSSCSPTDASLTHYGGVSCSTSRALSPTPPTSFAALLLEQRD